MLCGEQRYQPSLVIRLVPWWMLQEHMLQCKHICCLAIWETSHLLGQEAKDFVFVYSLFLCCRNRQVVIPGAYSLTANFDSFAVNSALSWNSKYKRRNLLRKNCMQFRESFIQEIGRVKVLSCYFPVSTNELTVLLTEYWPANQNLTD